MTRFLKEKLKVFKKGENKGLSNYYDLKKVYPCNLYIHGTTNNIFLTLVKKQEML